MKTPSTRRRTASSVSFASVNSLADLIQGLKISVAFRLTKEFRGHLPVALIRRAVEDAAETAQATEFPHLFFPLLAEEKVRLVSAALCEDCPPADLHVAA